MDNLTWFGHGWGQFYSTFPQHAVHIDTFLERPEHAHSDAIEIIYELGVGCVFAIAFLWSIGRTALATERAILAAFLVEGLFGFPFYMPATVAVFAIVAGRLAAAGPSLRDDLNACRAAIRNGMVANPKLWIGS